MNWLVNVFDIIRFDPFFSFTQSASNALYFSSVLHFEYGMDFVARHSSEKEAAVVRMEVTGFSNSLSRRKSDHHGSRTSTCSESCNALVHHAISVAMKGLVAELMHQS